MAKFGSKGKRRDRDRDRDERPRRSGKSGGGGFRYRDRGDEAWKKRQNQGGGQFDKPFRDGLKVFKPKAGENHIRILPPAHEDAEHYGIDVWMHYDVGPDGDSYLCRQRMGEGECPICKEISARKRAGEDEQELKRHEAKRRVLFWLIDRNKEDEGPQLYAPGWMFDRDIALVSQDRKTKQPLPIDHPRKGYDIFFTKSGEGKKTQYTGFQADRSPSPLSDDEDLAEEWLEYITENQLPDALNFYDPEHIRAKLDGGESDDDDDDDRPRTRRPRYDDDDDEEPRRRRKYAGRYDDDDDEDDEDEEDEDDRPSRRKSSRGSSKRRARTLDDVDEDDDDDEDDEPPRRVKLGGKKSKRKRSRDEDDDDIPF